MARQGTLSLDDRWNGPEGLKNAIERIFQHKCTRPEYMQIYTSIYDYCTATKNAVPEQNRTVPNARSQGRGGRARRQATQGAETFVGGELYDRLRSVINSKVSDIQKGSSEKLGPDLLKYYEQSWHNFKISIKTMNGVSSYLNKHWVSREREERGDDAQNSIYEIYNLGLIEWRNDMYQKLEKTLVHEIMKVIQSERNDETNVQNQHLLKKIIQESFVELGLQRKVPGKEGKEHDLIIYRKGFETPFLKETEEYYKKESNEFISSNSVVDYLVKVEKRFDEEQRRVQNYLDSSTARKVEGVAVKVLINAHIARLHDEFKVLLEQYKIDDLRRLYSLVKKSESHRTEGENNLDPMKSTFETHITQQGMAAVHQVKDNALSDPKSYIDTILNVHRKYYKIVQEAFDNDSGFATALDRAATKFVNENAVCIARSNRSRTSAELLAKYCDSILKKSTKMSDDDNEKERTMNDIITVFKFISEKDIFLEFYSKLFGNRLVKEISSSEENEETMIQKLKTECGYEYTSKLQKMFSDIVISKGLSKDFKEHVEKSSTPISVDFNIKVLTTGSWSYKKGQELKLPPEINDCKERFLNFYNGKHQGRKLTWIWNQCRGDIKYFPKMDQTLQFIFTATTHQMAIMLLFNNKDSYSVLELANLTEIETENDYMYKVLAQLLKAKILLCTNRTISDDDLVGQTDTLITNNKYKSKKKKINISMQIKQEQRQESDATVKKVEDDRALATQAAIVRIMKMRKKLNHNILLSDVVKQLQSRFKASVPLIKKQIELLVEKEYLARVEGEKDTYEYLA